LKWQGRNLAVDSDSTDETIGIVRSFSNADIVYRSVFGFADQCNCDLALIATTWVLSLDADYELSHDLMTELHALNPANTAAIEQASSTVYTGGP
jgi:hypothetical protein